MDLNDKINELGPIAYQVIYAAQDAGLDTTQLEADMIRERETYMSEDPLRGAYKQIDAIQNFVEAHAGRGSDLSQENIDNIHSAYRNLTQEYTEIIESIQTPDSVPQSSNVIKASVGMPSP